MNEMYDGMSRLEKIVLHIRYWLQKQSMAFDLWLESFRPCHKEKMGYTCQHRIMSNGKKECGEQSYPRI